ncbi:hypothetical protein ACN2XU_03815 [Primorskyibacter sp. 2E107]|uniref:hypothetical protein n=1 Tax=Primorskyibacter sp. 2E107 TaxID=3403458 RepID=UPI003AF472EE
MMRVILMGVLALSLAGCSSIRDRFGFAQNPEVFDGQRFRGTAKAPRGDRQSFVATAKPVSKSFDGAIEAARYEGIQHCIRYFGTSDIVWDSGPDTPREAMQIDNDTLIFRGTCEDK